MAAYVVVHARKKNDGKYDEYAAVAGPSILANGGEIVVRGPAKVLAGESEHPMMVIAKFPNKEDAEKWYNSSEYQSIIPTRGSYGFGFFPRGGLTVSWC